MSGKHAPAIGIDFAERDSSHADLFKPEGEATDAGKEVEDIHCAPMVAGDRVGLTDIAAQTFTQASKGSSKTNWHTRRGTLLRLHNDAACVQWDDRKTVDYWPPKALSLARPRLRPPS